MINEKMERREFIKRLGLGTGALFLASPLLSSALRPGWASADAVRFAVEQAMQAGAVYADACIGPCRLTGGKGPYASPNGPPTPLLQDRALGMRICTESGWRQVLLADPSRSEIARQVPLALRASPDKRKPREYWTSAEYAAHELLASHSSDPAIAAQIGHKWLRYADRQPLPPSTAQAFFCDILLIH